MSDPEKGEKAEKGQKGEKGETLETISGNIDSQARNSQIRHSLQPKPSPSIPVHIRRHSSLGKNRNSNQLKRPSVPDILETDRSDDDGTIDYTKSAQTPPDGSVRISFTKKTRKISNVSKANKNSLQHGISMNNLERSFVFVNNGYNNHSAGTSLHGSMTSLPVIREQYCCFQRWTKCEKTLAIVVAVFAFIIIILIVAVGILSKHETDHVDRTWPLKF